MSLRHEDAPSHRRRWAPLHWPGKIARAFAAAGVETRVLSGPLYGIETGNPVAHPLLFIHGSPGGWHHFSDYLMDPDLLKRACMRAPDRPGYGETEPKQPNPSLSGQAASLAKCIDTDAPAIVVGHSYGGPVAVRMAIDFPERVSYLVLIAPALDPELEPIPLYQRLAGRPGVSRWLPPAWQTSLTEVLHLPDELRALQTRMPQVTCPVVLIHGDRDRLVPFTNVTFAHEHLEDVPVHTHRLIHADHYLPWTHYDLVRDRLLQVLEKIRGTTIS